MKKIILSLSTTVLSIVAGFGQNLTITAPPANSTSQVRAPNGTSTQAGLRACYIVTPSELANLTAGVISTIGFSVSAGTGSSPVPGTFTLYLQSTPSTTYGKGVNWPTILTGMTPAYVGTYTVPAGTGASVITFPVNFNFTIGGGLYVAYEWESNGPFAVNPATYYANNSLAVGGALIDTPTLPTPTVLVNNNFRPTFIFTGVNTVTNEIGVLGVESPGKINKLINNTQAPVAYVKNYSTIAKSNIVLTLNVGGANSFTDTKTIASLASGAIGTVTFNSFPSTVSGINTLSVTSVSDQVNSNNLATWTQSVSCVEGSFDPPLTAINFSAQGYGFGAGAPTGGIYAFKYTTVAGGSVTSVRVAVPSFTQNIGKQIFAVVLDGSGNIIASGNTITLASGNFNTFVNLPFTLNGPVDLSPATDYYIGLNITAGNTYPIGVIDSPIPIQSFYTAPDVGGSITSVDFGYLAIEAVFTAPDIALKASSARSPICLGESVALTASTENSAPTTFTWSANTGSNTVNVSNITVTPTNTGNTVYSVSGNNTASGCKTNAVNITQVVTLCTGIATNGSVFQEVRIFPNPTIGGKSTINGLTGINNISIHNLLGQVVLTQQTDKENFAIDLSNQPSGTYLVKILNTNNETKVVKIVNQN